MNKHTMERPPLPINITMNQNGNGAILHINCQSDGRDGRVERWMVDKEEASTQAKNLWLGKLGCLLKLHGGIEYTFNDPWDYRISDFPENYKLFSVERQAQGENPPRKDHYLCGRDKAYRSPQEFYPHLHWLLNSARGDEEPCICQYCSGRSQKAINKIFYLPPCKEGTKHTKSPNKHRQTRRLKGPKGVTSKRGLIINRNSIMTGPLATLGHGSMNYKTIGYRRSHPFQ